MLVSSWRTFLGAQGKVKKLNEHFITASSHKIHDCPASCCQWGGHFGQEYLFEKHPVGLGYA